jgi:hypothetical protein
MYDNDQYVIEALFVKTLKGSYLSLRLFKQ